MKIKHIDSIIIGDTKFKVKWDKKKGGGSFSYDYKPEKTKAYIEIGCIEEKQNPITVLNTIMHELKEIIQVEQGTRFKTGNNDYQFFYNHQQHTDLCSRLSGLLSQFIQ